MNEPTTLLHPQILCEYAELAPGMSVGDFGCGAHGALVHYAAGRVGETGRVYAVDVRPHILTLVERGHFIRKPQVPIETVWSDIERYGATSIPHSSLDRIFLIQVVSQLKDIVAALRECERLLVHNGKIVVVDWTHQNHPLAPGIIVPPEIVGRAGLEVGLSADEIFAPSENHWGMLLRRN